MSQAKAEVFNVIQNTIEETGALRNSKAARAMAELIMNDLFVSDHWEAIQEYLNERVNEELPDRV